MRLKSLKIKNFRGYRNEARIIFNDLSVFTGRNDAGKSSILEALEIFFNNSTVKIDKEDINVAAAAAGESKIEITCVFDNLPDELIIDAASPTTLENEYLLNTDGDLEIKKIFGGATMKEQVFIVANHPAVANGSDLLMLRRQELRQRAQDIGVPAENYNGNVNSSLRSAIWEFLPDLNLSPVEIQVDKEDAKKAWEYLSRWMPQFALFKSDRESTDGDKEVTNPMKVAINNALAEMQDELDAIQERVREKAVDVADRTLAKLREMNPALANHLTPDFKSDPKWSGLFSLTLASDNNIPINKRGSGVRRLIVLNFFRAEAERRRNENNSQAIIYAFEEPENSQHPDHQAMLMRSFQELADVENTQVFVTTHNPALAGLVNPEDLFLVSQNAQGDIEILHGDPDILRRIAKTLGMLPEPLKPKILVCVEGPNDVLFFKTISAMINAQRNDLPNLSTDTRVALFPLGGGTLKDWVTHDYLKGFDIPQYHIYDLDDPANPPYQQQCNDIRARAGQDWAELTTKRETENYIHPDCIHAVYGFRPAFGDMDDVPGIVASTVHNNTSPNPWNTLSPEDQKKKASRAKKRLNTEVASLMTFEQLQQSDATGDIIRWLEDIGNRIAN